MSNSPDSDSPAATDFEILHDADRQRFIIVQTDAPAGSSSSDQPRTGARDVLGEAHYTLIGDDRIDFDHTLVQPQLRGTGLAARLARTALTSPIVAGRNISASCSYINAYLHKHPDLARPSI